MESAEAGTLSLYRPDASAKAVSRVLAVTRAIGAGRPEKASVTVPLICTILGLADSLQANCASPSTASMANRCFMSASLPSLATPRTATICVSRPIARDRSGCKGSTRSRLGGPGPQPFGDARRVLTQVAGHQAGQRPRRIVSAAFGEDTVVASSGVPGRTIGGPP